MSAVDVEAASEWDSMRALRELEFFHLVHERLPRDADADPVARWWHRRRGALSAQEQRWLDARIPTWRAARESTP